MFARFLDLAPPPQGPAQGAGRNARVLPFAGVGAAALVMYLMSNWHTLTPVEGGVLAALVGSLVLGWAYLPWDHLPRAAQVLLPVGAIALIAVMQVAALPHDIDLAALMIAPVLWAGLYGTAREALTVTTLAVALITGLQAVAGLSGDRVGLTGWTEVIALSGGLGLLAYFTVTARTHARTDALTGAANRRSWDEVVALEIDRARRYGGRVAVAMIDLDHFKALNDTQGHAQGDRHLTACARAWSGCLRQSDVLARLGGEEFAVLLVGADADADAVAHRIIEATPNGESCSVGLAQWDGVEEASALMARADDALYAAKTAGRGRVVHADHAVAAAGTPVFPRIAGA